MTAYHADKRRLYVSWVDQTLRTLYLSDNNYDEGDLSLALRLSLNWFLRGQFSPRLLVVTKWTIKQKCPLARFERYGNTSSRKRWARIGGGSGGREKLTSLPAPWNQICVQPFPVWVLASFCLALRVETQLPRTMTLIWVPAWLSESS